MRKLSYLKTIILITCTLGQFAIVYSNLIPPFQHETSIFIGSDGSIQPSGFPINRQGDTCFLTGNISAGIAIEKSNITLNGNGFSITGNNSGSGCLITGDSVTITNLRVEGFVYGVFVAASFCRVEGIVSECGIEVTYPSNQIVNNVVEGNIGIASNDNTCTSNEATSICVQGSRNTVSHSHISDKTRIDAYLLQAHYVGGFYIDHADKCTFINNTIERKTIGLNILYSTNLHFSGNTLRDNQVGIKIDSPDLEHYSHVFDNLNTVDGKPIYYLVNVSDYNIPINAGWICAVNCKNITVQNWVSTPNWHGIIFAYTNDSTIERSVLSHNFNAVYVHGCCNVTIKGNSIKDNDYCALYLNEVFNSTITSNHAENNYCLFNVRINTNENVIYNNNFVGGWLGAFSKPLVQNRWDNGSLGNYWNITKPSVPAWVDNNHDGINDYPFVIDDYSGSVDNFPLCEPFNFSIPEPNASPVPEPSTEPTLTPMPTPSFSPKPITTITPIEMTNQTPTPTPSPQTVTTPNPKVITNPEPTYIQPSTPMASSTPPPTPPMLEEPTFGMPKEYLNYTITSLEGKLWAIVDGIYPIYFSNNDEKQELSMVYPTPPGTTNISLTLDGTPLTWTNYTEQFPTALHHTAIGDWPMILVSFEAPRFFTLTIHYEHPIEETNGGYRFLYDLNISPYLTAQTPNSTAYFKIAFERTWKDLQVSNTPSDEILNPRSYNVSEQEPTITFEVTSEYAKPLPGDVLVEFTINPPKDATENAILSQIFYFIVPLIVGTAAFLFIFRRRKNAR